MAQEKFEAAAAVYAEVVAVRARLAAADRGDRERQRDLAFAHARLASAYDALGRREEALAELRKGRAIMAELVAADPSNAPWKSLLAWLDEQIARLQ
jgi:hypothetical protein